MSTIATSGLCAPPLAQEIFGVASLRGYLKSGIPSSRAMPSRRSTESSPRTTRMQLAP